MESVDKITAETGDYFDDELTAQLNITKSWLQEALVTRQHELQRLNLVDLLRQQSIREQCQQEGRRKNGNPLNPVASTGRAQFW